MKNNSPVALTIAGSDPSGGAGLQADLKTFHQFGVYGQAVLTLATVQNTRRVSEVYSLNAGLVARQLEAVSEDIPPDAAKTGALGTAEIVREVASWAAATGTPLVVDPVMISKHGAELIPPEAQEALAEKLLPLARIVTPNIPEAERLAGIEIRSEADMLRAAERILALGAQAVLLKGGHLEGAEALDLLLDGAQLFEFRAPRLATRHTHGTGCVTAAAITAGLALGRPMEQSVGEAKRFVLAAIRTAPELGAGAGPLNLFAALDDSGT